MGTDDVHFGNSKNFKFVEEQENENVTNFEDLYPVPSEQELKILI
jgi:hypothetical protein